MIDSIMNYTCYKSACMFSHICGLYILYLDMHICAFIHDYLVIFPKLQLEMKLGIIQFDNLLCIEVLTNTKRYESYQLHGFFE